MRIFFNLYCDTGTINIAVSKFYDILINLIYKCNDAIFLRLSRFSMKNTLLQCMFDQEIINIFSIAEKQFCVIASSHDTNQT